MKAGWVIQQYYLESEPDGEAIIRALEKQDVDFEITSWRPGDDGYHWSSSNVDIIGLIGSISFVRGFHKNYVGPELYPFFTDEVHRYSNYKHKIPYNELLNKDGYLLTLADIIRRPQKQTIGLYNEDSVFIRPDQALKIKEAEVVTQAYFNDWINLTENYSGASDNSLFWLFDTKKIHGEFRFVVVDREVVSGSQYINPAGEIDYSAKVSDDIFRYAKNVAKEIWLDEQVYILDVAITDDGFKVIELNAFSTSGLYFTNKDVVFRKVTDQLLKIAEEWNL